MISAEQPREVSTSRRELPLVGRNYFPSYVVWELTLACDLACKHCGSRAGPARPNELTVEEALRVADELAEMGAREVVLIGGEAYLHAGFLEITRRLADQGVAPTLTTGGRGITGELARKMKQSGMARVSVSVDGLEPAHDRLRGVRGSFRSALLALEHSRDAGLVITANTNVNRSNHHDLEELLEVLLEQGIRSWQVQLTTPLGRAADRSRLVLQPFDLLDLLPRIARLKEVALERGVLLLPGNNLGYFGPEEGRLRALRDGASRHFSGCQAGKFVLGVESDGAVKGCPSLQTAFYVGGNVRERSLREIWQDSPELAFNRARTVSDLWGYCASCDFREACLGGCTFTAHAILGRPGNNPYCHFRARDFQKRGLRERLVLVDGADGAPFDNARYEIVVEPHLDVPDPEYADPTRSGLVQITRRPRRASRREKTA